MRLRPNQGAGWSFDSLQISGVSPPRVSPRHISPLHFNNQESATRLGADARHKGSNGANAGFAPTGLGAEDKWDSLLHIVRKIDHSVVSAADGRAAGHSHAARMEAAAKLIENHARVLNDVTNPSFDRNIDGKTLTQIHLVRVETFRASYVDQCLLEVARRLLGRQPGLHQMEVRLSPSNQAQSKVWSQTAAYLNGRIQCKEAEMPGRTADMSAEAATAMRDVLAEVGDLGVNMALAASAPIWASLRRVLDAGGGFDSEADGAAAKHSHDSREGAARKLVSNHARVLRDVVNPSQLENIEGKSLTQPDLNRVAPMHAAHIDEMLQEVACRLIGRRPGVHLLRKRLEPSNPTQASAWAKGASYLDARIQFTADQKPGREPDMSPHSAMAFRAVLLEIIQAAEAPNAPMGHARWQVFAKSIREGAGFSTLADGVASAHSHRAREDAAAKLVANHTKVLADVVNDSHLNIDKKPLTQLELERVAPTLWTFADECLREVARRLLGRRPGLDQLEEFLDPSNREQVEAWVRTCRYMDGRIQSDPGQKPGREPDMNKMAAAAMRAVLKEVGSIPLTNVIATSTPIWDAFRHILECGGGFASQANGAAAAHPHAAREEAASALIKKHENVLRDVTNPSRDENINGKSLTQLELQRVALSSVLYADQALREVARRLLGLRPGLHQLEEHIDPFQADQVAAWAQAATYLDGWIHSMESEMPGRTPDISPSAAVAMRAVLYEVAGMGITATLNSSASMWSKLHERLQRGHGSSADEAITSADGEAASKLILNHELVLRDVCNPSRTRDATSTVELTQTALVRVATPTVPYADQALREIARRLLSNMSDSIDDDQNAVTVISTPSKERDLQADAFVTTCTYLTGRIQGHEAEMPGRTPDMSPSAAAAMRAVLKEVGAMHGHEQPSTHGHEQPLDKSPAMAGLVVRRSIANKLIDAVSPRKMRRQADA